jgi:hypothetical protein
MPETIASLRATYPDENEEQLIARVLEGYNQLDDQLKELQDASRSSKNPQPATPSTTSNKAILPKPPLFGGERNEYQVWHNKVQAKLRLDAHVIGENEENQVAYIYALLEGSAAEYLSHYFKLWGQDVTVIGVWEYLDRRYEDVHRKQRAAAEHDNLKQGSKPFPEFMAELDRLQSEAGIDTWPAEVLIANLRAKVSSELKQLAVTKVGLPKDDYQAVVNYYHELYNNLIVAKDNGAFKYDVLGNRARNTTGEKPKQMAPPPLQRVRNESAQKDPDAMDWVQTASTQKREDKRPRAPPISAAELEARRKQGVCFTCGNAGHMSRQCYYAPPPRRPQVSSVQTTKPELKWLASEEAASSEPPTYDDQSKE